jgi:hypothetical protein
MKIFMTSPSVVLTNDRRDPPAPMEGVLDVYASAFLVAATGQAIRTPELAIYRVDRSKIVECWGDLGSAVRDQLTWGTPG